MEYGILCRYRRPERIDDPEIRGKPASPSGRSGSGKVAVLEQVKPARQKPPATRAFLLSNSNFCRRLGRESRDRFFRKFLFFEVGREGRR